MRLVDCASGRGVRRIVPFPGEIQVNSLASLKFSPDGTRFIYLSHTRDAMRRPVGWRVKVWDWSTGREVFADSGLAGLVVAPAFDRSAGRLAMGIIRSIERGGGDLIVRDVESRKQLLAIPLPDRRFGGWSSIAFSPDGSRIAALLRPAGPLDTRSAIELRAWDAASGKEIFRHGTGPGSTGLAYSPDGRRLAVSYDGGTTHRIRDAGSGEEILELTSAADGMTYLDTIAFSPAGTRLACASEDGKARIWDVAPDDARPSRPPDRILGGNHSRVNEVAWSPDSRYVSASGWGCKFLTWPVAAQEERLVFEGPEDATWVGPTSAAGTNRFAAAFETPRGRGETRIAVWDGAGRVVFETTEAALDGPEASYDDRAVKLSRDGTRLAYRATVRSRDGEPESAVGRIRVWDIATGREIFRQDREGACFPVFALSSDGRLLAASSSRGTGSERTSSVSVWDLGLNRELLHLEPDREHPERFAFSPDGRRFAGLFEPRSGGPLACEPRVWDLATGRAILARKWNEGYSSELVYSGDGRWLALALSRGEGGGVIKVVDADGGEVSHSLAGHGAPISRMAVSPDGRRLASSDSSPTRAPEVKLWDLALGRELLTFSTKGLEPSSRSMGAAPSANSLSFSPDGHRLSFIVGSWGREARVQVWDATPMPDEGPEISRRRP